MLRTFLVAALCCGVLFGCDREGQTPAQATSPGAVVAPAVAAVENRQVTYTEAREPCSAYTDTRMPLFGDVHVHTSYSFDAAANSIGATPRDAQRFARGEAIPFWPLDDAGKPAGAYQLDRPLDFLAVTDHGEFLGEKRLCSEPGSPRFDSAFCTNFRADQRQGMTMLGMVITSENPRRIVDLCGEDGAQCRNFADVPWQQEIAAAEEAYDRSAACTFTSFVAYEYTGTPGTSNYHRNVIFRNANVPALPVTYVDAPFDSALWAGLDAACTVENGCDYLTIPHNTNLANGRMAPYMRLEQSDVARRQYADTRLAREPIMEIFQHKGGSECINGLTSVLSAPDELCDIEAVRVMDKAESYTQMGPAKDGIPTRIPVTEVTKECEPGEIGSYGMLGAGCVDATDYQRSALLVGIEENARIGANPVKLGVIASTDTHAATPGAAVESDWRGHVSVEQTPGERLQPGLLTSGIDGNPGGLAGVWAMENSRDAIFEAMKRREVFGTSGPRIVPRFFGGWSYPRNLCERADLVDVGYAEGVPMGGDLPAAPADGKPVFVASVLRDPTQGAQPLAALQVIKGWIDGDGKRHADVMTVAGSLDSSTPAQDSLCVTWVDEHFDAARPAYYYLRAVEPSTPRWSAYDCERLAPEARPAVCTDGSYPAQTREMAWTSPIWYDPAGS
ncbi:MAG: DUF3604 domain-containing protein [Pseudomonadales bacterium]